MNESRQLLNIYHTQVRHDSFQQAASPSPPAPPPSPPAPPRASIPPTTPLPKSNISQPRTPTSYRKRPERTSNKANDFLFDEDGSKPSQSTDKTSTVSPQAPPTSSTHHLLTPSNTEQRTSTLSPSSPQLSSPASISKLSPPRPRSKTTIPHLPQPSHNPVASSSPPSIVTSPINDQKILPRINMAQHLNLLMPLTSISSLAFLELVCLGDNPKLQILPYGNNLLTFLDEVFQTLSKRVNKTIVIYIDGIADPITNTQGGRYGVWFGGNDRRNVVSFIKDEAVNSFTIHLKATIRALEIVSNDHSNDKVVEIRTLSPELVLVVTKLMPEWKAKGWNIQGKRGAYKSMFLRLDELLSQRKAGVEWKCIPRKPTAENLKNFGKPAINAAEGVHQFVIAAARAGGPPTNPINNTLDDNILNAKAKAVNGPSEQNGQKHVDPNPTIPGVHVSDKTTTNNFAQLRISNGRANSNVPRANTKSVEVQTNGANVNEKPVPPTCDALRPEIASNSVYHQMRQACGTTNSNSNPSATKRVEQSDPSNVDSNANGDGDPLLSPLPDFLVPRPYPPSGWH